MRGRSLHQNGYINSDPQQTADKKNTEINQVQRRKTISAFSILLEPHKLPTMALYDISVPMFLRSLENLATFLKKGEDWAKENGKTSEDLINHKLAPDMKALAFQIQRVSDTAKNSAGRLGGFQAPSMPDDETTYEQLYTRIQKTIDVLKGTERSAFEGKEEAQILLPLPGKELKFTGRSYLTAYAIPNFFFHVSMAYAILRNAGAPVGKMDFLGNPESA
jgi:hypothetical protein